MVHGRPATPPPNALHALALTSDDSEPRAVGDGAPQETECTREACSSTRAS